MSSPLYDAHAALNATFTTVTSAPDTEDGHPLPARYSDLEDEVAAARAAAAAAVRHRPTTRGVADAWSLSRSGAQPV